MILPWIFLMELFIDISAIEFPIPLNFPEIDWKSTNCEAINGEYPRRNNLGICIHRVLNNEWVKKYEIYEIDKLLEKVLFITEKGFEINFRKYLKLNLLSKYFDKK